MALQYPKQVNKLIVGSLAIGMILLAWLLVPFKLLELKNTHPDLYDALEWTIIFGLMGFALAWGLDPNIEVRTGKQDLVQGVLYSVVFLALGFLLNYLFIFGQQTYSLLGDTSMSNETRLLASYSAAINEELFFRAGLQRIFIRLMPDNPFFWVLAIFASATIFSVFHVYVYGTQGPQPFLYLFFLGSMAGLGLLVTKRLSVAFLIHAENNLLSFFWGVL